MMKLNRFKLYFFLIFLITIVMLFSSFSMNEKNKQIKYSRIHVLYLVLNTGNKSIDHEELKTCVDYVRLFVWKHTHCKIDFRPIFIDVDEDIVFKEFLAQNEINPELLNELLFYHLKIKTDIYKTVLFILPSDYLTRKKIISDKDKNRLFHIIPADYRSKHPYPADKNVLYQNLIWPVLNVYIRSIYYLGNLPPVDVKKDMIDPYKRENFKAIAEELEGLSDIRLSNSNGVDSIIAADNDEDGIPDDDPTVILDEYRFGSRVTLLDTDNDGLSDFKEFTDLLFRATNPADRDSDDDGLIDGDDLYPHIAIQPEIPKFTPSFNGSLDQWYLFARDLSYKYYSSDIKTMVKPHIHMSWDDDYLYFASETNIPALLEINFDFNNDGWNQGRDNYYMVIDPFSDRFEELRVLDNTERAMKITDNSARSVWDNESRYIVYYGRLVDEDRIKLVTEIQDNQNGNRFIIKMAIPRDDQTGLLLEQGKKIGIKVKYMHKIFNRVELIASMHEPDTFFKLELR